MGLISHSHLRLINGLPQRYVDDGCGWVLEAAVSGGGALRNLGIHGIDAFLALAGDQEIAVEQASFGRQLHGTQVEDYALVVLRAVDGSIGLVEAGYTYTSIIGGIFDWRVSARNASLTDLGDRLQVATLDDGTVCELAATPVAERYQALMADTITGSRLAGSRRFHCAAIGGRWISSTDCYALRGKQTDMLRVGIIGAGHFGAEHARALASVGGARLVAACRDDEAGLREFCRAFGGKGYRDYRDLLADPAVDAVVVAVPHYLHTEVAIAAGWQGDHAGEAGGADGRRMPAGPGRSAGGRRGADAGAHHALHPAVPLRAQGHRKRRDRPDALRLEPDGQAPDGAEPARLASRSDEGGRGMLFTAGIHALD